MYTDDDAVEAIKALPSAEPEVKCVANVSFDEDDLKRIVYDIVDNLELDVIRCKDCKHFELNKKYVIQGIPILGHEVCDAWGDGCKTSPDGFCFMAERRQDE